MGADIYIYTEIQKDNGWEPVPEPAISRSKKVPIDSIDLSCTRPDRLYVMLSGIYHHAVLGVARPISELRGLPNDMNAVYKEYFDQHGTGFGCSWLMVGEIINYKWDSEFVMYRACVDKKYAPLFHERSPFPDAFPKGASIYYTQQPGTDWVSWKSSCREFVNLDHETCLEDFIEELLKLGEPDKVRIIFWFL